MNKLIKFAVTAGVIAPALLASSAFAASISNPLFSNGQTTIDAAGNSTVSGTYTLTVGAGEVVEWVRTQADTMPFTDTSVGGPLGLQEGVYTNQPFSAKVSPNTGSYNVNIQTAGIFMGNRAINGGDSVNGSNSLGTVRVVAGASTGSDVPSGIPQSVWDKFLAWMSGSTTPAPSSKCADLTTKLVGTTDNQYSDANASLQGFLIAANANSIPALKAGASFGYKGDQTRSAVISFKAANQCN